MNTKRLLALLPAIGLLLPACRTVRQQAFYVSPFNGQATAYQPLPVVIDSAHTAVYAQATYSSGSANEENTDHFSGFQGAVTVAHHGKNFQAFYGGDLTLGNYHMGRWDSGYTNDFIRQRTAPPLSAALLNSYQGNRSYGGAGFHGGINFVIPTRRGEWRALGLETSLHREFGDYYSFRKQLSDTAATLIAHGRFYGVIGLSSELVGYTAHGEFGFRLAFGWALGSPYTNPDVYDNESGTYLRYGYSSLSFHYTQGKYTGSLQVNGGTKASSLGIGLAYRLGRPRLAPIPEKHHRQTH